MTEAERRVLSVRRALSVLRGIEDKKDVARALGIAVRTLESYACDVGAKGHRPISQNRLANLMFMAGNRLRDAAAEMDRAAKTLDPTA